jgi:hypothetical protein
MTGFSLVLILGIVVLLVAWPRLLRVAREAAQGAAEDPGDGAVVRWYVFIVLIALIYGVWAVRFFWHSLPRGEYGFGGLIFMIMAIPVFMIGMAAASGILLFVGRFVGRRGRLVAAGLAALVLMVGFLMPMHRDSLAEERKARASDVAWFEANLAEGRALMATVDHAPPGVVPDILEVTRGGLSIDVRNLSKARLTVNVLLVIPRDRQWERCSLGVEARNCTAEAGACSYQLGKDGSEQITNPVVYNPNPVLEPGQLKSFRDICGARFDRAPMEFRITDKNRSRLVFQSDSAFVPDQPQLWK